MQGDRRSTSSGIEVRPVYTEDDRAGCDAAAVGRPGEYPYTRGIHPDMYRGRLWTMRQYAGFGTAESTNRRFRLLLDAGQTGLSCAFDLPTQMGYDPDAPEAEGEVGRVGVSVASIEDMRALLEGLPLGAVTTSMTINATAPVLLLLYQLVAEEQGVPAARLGGTVQNDVLKEYVARGTYIYPPRASLRLATDLMAYCGRELPAWNPISVSGYHMREAGATAVQELAFTLASGIAYVQAAVDAGMAVDDVGARLSFFFNGHSNLFEEVAKFRAARRMWARIMVERFGARSPAAQKMRFHTQTGGSTLTAQQPEANVVRVALQGLAAVLGGTQSLHTNALDEALGLPSAAAARLALRTQQVIAHESGVTDTVDPLAGSWFVESLTDEVEAAAGAYLARIDALGGAVAALEAGFQQGEIEQAAYAHARAVEAGERVIVGVNRYVDEAPEVAAELSGAGGDDVAASQVERLRRLRSSRSAAAVDAALADLAETAAGAQNVLYPMKAALAAGATLGEVSDRLRTVFGTYRGGP